MRYLVPIIATVLLAAGSVDAMTPPIGHPSRIALLEGSDEVELRAAHTMLRCRALDDCEFETTYRLVADAERDVVLIADGHRVAGFELTVAGANVLGSNVTRDNDGNRELPAVTRTTRQYQVRLGPGETEVILRGEMNPRGTEDLGGVAVSLPTRHPLFGTDPGWQRRNFLFDLSTASTWAGSAKPSFDVEMPDALDVRAPETGSVDPDKQAQLSIWTAQRAGGVVHGGPYIGVGGIIDEPGGWFGRAGYEFGVGLWTVLGVAVDTDFSSRVVVSPTVHMASAAFSCIFPSFGLGVGPALQLGSTTAVGGRGLVEVQVPFVGLVGTLDWYPGLDSPDRIDFALLGRLSF